MNDLQGRIDRRLEINYKRSGASGGSSFIPWSLQRRKKELEALEENYHLQTVICLNLLCISMLQLTALKNSMT